MKLPTKFLIVALLLASLVPGQMVLQSFARSRQYEWAAVQSKRCSAMGVLLYEYHEKHQSFPESLRQLVDSGLVTEARYRELMFQQKSGASPQEWKYHRPETPHHFPLFSGKPVTTWNSPIVSYIIGGADGSAIVFGNEKLRMFKRNHLDASQLTD
ncbi:MAG: hypothetical protein V4640_09975 [Verrucomicrobiota bacterium]